MARAWIMKNDAFITIWCIFLHCFVFAKSESRPHIVFIVADDFGWNDVGFRNNDIKSPNIDKLAREGVILDQAYVQPVCSPSRSAFMTGMYPFKTGLQHIVIWPNQNVCSPLKYEMLPQKLKRLGYETHMIGKWHLGFCKWECTPTYRGFDSFYGYYTSREDYYTKENHGWHDFRKNENRSTDSVGVYSTYDYSERARLVISQHNKSKPLFLYLPLQSVHEPVEVPDVYRDMYKHINNTGRRTFSGMVTAMDDAIGNVTEALKKHELYNNTLIIFTADNGGWPTKSGNNFPLRGSKLTVYEGGTRVTAFVHGAGLSKTGYTYKGMIHAVDWSPTIFAAAGGTSDNDIQIDGLNQWESIKDNVTSKRSEFIYNLDDIAPYETGHKAIRMDKYKLIIGSPGLYPNWYPVPTSSDDIHIKEYPYDSKNENKTQLFNLEDDPNEHNDLSKELPEVVEKLRRRIEFYWKQMVPANYPKPDNASDPRNYNGFWTPGWC